MHTGFNMSTIQTCTPEEFAEYGKIDTLFERDERFVVNPSILRKRVIGTIREWEVTEKIDGTNIRVMFSEHGTIRFGGRTQNAQVPADLMQFLMRTFTPDALKSVFWIDASPVPVSVILYGEGYGAGIQKGGGYRPDKGFILFDVLVAGKWWLDRPAVEEIASKLGVPAVPNMGLKPMDEIVDLVRNGFKSLIGDCQAEGIVARPIETLFDKRGERLIIKLKTKDFVPGKR